MASEKPVSHTIPQHVSVLTLAVSDLERARTFYEAGFGWKIHPAEDSDDVVFYQLQGSVLALWRRESLAADAGLSEEQLRPGGVSIAHNVASPEAADAVIAAALAAGGRLVRAAQQVYWGGYTAYIADPEGHLWEIAHNPGWPLSPDGRIVMPFPTADDSTPGGDA